MLRLWPAVAGLALIGAAPKDEASDIGAAPTWTQAVALGEAALKANLIDPSSAQIEWPYNFTPGSLKALLGKRRSGYYTCGYVNARNRMGGYSGRSWFLILIRDGVVSSLDIGTVDGIDTATATCPNLVAKGLLNPAPEVALPKTPGTMTQAEIQSSAATSASAAAAKGGLGVSFLPSPFGALLMAVAPGSLAQVAGLKPGETVEAVNGVPLKDLPADAMIKVLQGPTGTVTLSIIGVGDVKVVRPSQ